MISISKRYCISDGPCNIGDVIEVEPNEHMVGVTAKKKPKTNLLTRGINPARVVAHNLPFDRRMIGKDAFADNFKMLYASGQDSPTEFWSITVTKGEKAILKLLSADEAAKLFNELPRKLYPHTFLFNPERYKREIAAVRTANEDLKVAERERLEQEEWNSLSPYERMDRTQPLDGWG